MNGSHNSLQHKAAGVEVSRHLVAACKMKRGREDGIGPGSIKRPARCAVQLQACFVWQSAVSGGPACLPNLS